MSDAIRVDRAGRRANVVLDRGEKRNALTLAMWRELARTFRDLDADDDLRCIVLRGSGEQDFSAGADISEFQSVRSDRAQAREYGATVESAIAAIAECRHPTVAAIRGACVGGGLELAAVCDIRIATSSSRLGAPVSRIGVTMAPAEMVALVDLVGRATLAELLLTAEVVDAKRALSLGLVNRVVSEAQFENELATLVDLIVAGAPHVHRMHKRFLRHFAARRLLSEPERDDAFAFADTDDYRIGVEAFLARSDPEFSGR